MIWLEIARPLMGLLLLLHWGRRNMSLSCKAFPSVLPRPGSPPRSPSGVSERDQGTLSGSSSWQWLSRQMGTSLQAWPLQNQLPHTWWTLGAKRYPFSSSVRKFPAATEDPCVQLSCPSMWAKSLGFCPNSINVLIFLHPHLGPTNDLR